jgi:hypothetical protein
LGKIVIIIAEDLGLVQKREQLEELQKVALKCLGLVNTLLIVGEVMLQKLDLVLQLERKVML